MSLCILSRVLGTLSCLLLLGPKEGILDHRATLEVWVDTIKNFSEAVMTSYIP